MPRYLSCVALSVLALVSVPASAIDLVEAWDLARKHEPQFQAAKAERDANLANANQSLAAYLPQASYQMTNVPTESFTRQVVQINQPVVSVDRYALLKQRGPRREFAESTFDVREQELAQRTLRAVVDIIRASESARLNSAKIDALREQSERAERLFKGGQGTLTDARDIQVRYEQAQSNQAILESELEAARLRFQNLTGVEAPADAFAMPAEHPRVPLEAADSYLARLEKANPQIKTAEQAERISRLDVLKARGALLPTVGAQAQYSRANGVGDEYIGIAITAPLSASSAFQVTAARANARRSAEELRNTTQRVRVEFERLFSLVNAGERSLQSNMKAVEAAELSVEANKKSYEGGVRTNVDVVNSIQVLFEVKNQYVTTATSLADNMLSMQLLAAVEPRDALVATQKFLFGR